MAEALRDSDDIKKERNATQKENKDLRERLEAVEKTLRMKSLQRSTGHSHSHDSAIDSDLQEWETEAVDIDMGGLGKFYQYFKVIETNYKHRYYSIVNRCGRVVKDHVWEAKTWQNF